MGIGVLPNSYNLAQVLGSRCWVRTSEWNQLRLSGRHGNRNAFDTAVWPTCDAYIWPTTLLCIVQSYYESTAAYTGVLDSLFPAASGGAVVMLDSGV